MAIRIQRFPEYDLNLHVISRPHSGEEAIRFFEGLGAPQDATRWLTYFDPSVDMSGVDVASLPRLKRCIAEKQRELFGETAPPPRVLVCSTSAHEEFFARFWSGYVLKGEIHPVKPAIVCGLQAAYDRFGLAPGARAAIGCAVRDLAAPDLSPALPRRGAAPASAG